MLRPIDVCADWTLASGLFPGGRRPGGIQSPGAGRSCPTAAALFHSPPKPYRGALVAPSGIVGWEGSGSR